MDSLSQLHRAQPLSECFVIQLSECGSAAWNISCDGQSSVPTLIGTTQPSHYNRSVYNSVAARGGPMEQMLAQWCSGWGPNPLWDTAKLVKMTSSICWVTFNQDCYLQLVFSMPGDRPSRWNYSLTDRAWAPRLSVRVLMGPAYTRGHRCTRDHVANGDSWRTASKGDRWVSLTSMDENETQF